MNERIDNLLYQSGLTAQGCWDELGTYEQEAIEKFAELIVRECGHLMVDIMLYGGVAPEQGYDIMLKHFGVEE